MKTWAYVAGAAAAIGALAVVTLALRRSVYAEEDEQIPKLIADCQERVHRIDSELQKLRASTAL